MIIRKECANTNLAYISNLWMNLRYLLLPNTYSLLVLGNYIRRVSYKLEGIVPKGLNTSDPEILKFEI